MSGRIAAIEAVESDPNVIFVGAATGGLWKSVNGGQSWESLFDDQRVLGIGAVAVFQADPDIVWVGTGEGNPRNSAGVGAGIYKSMDGGRSWTLLGLGRSERIHRIVLHPTDPDVAYAGVMGPAWSDGEERGVYRTVDGGATWERVLFVNQRTGVSDLVMDPLEPGQALCRHVGVPTLALVLRIGRGRAAGSTSPRTAGPPGRGSTLGGRPSRRGAGTHRPWPSPGTSPDVVYALVEAGRSALIRSDDGGMTWETVNDDEGVASRPFYYADIFVDPAERAPALQPPLPHHEIRGRG